MGDNLGGRTPPPFVGRDDLVSDVLARFDAAPPRGVVITGPAGQGKTALARELLGRLADADRPTAATYATASAGSVPLGALTGALATAAARPQRVVDLVQQAIRALEAQARTAGGPVAWWIDDAHLLDPASATVVHQVTASGAATPIVTLRRGEPSPDAVTAVWKDGFADRLDLGPLTRDELALLAATIVDGPLGLGAAITLHQISGGNPLLATELLRGALDTDALCREQGRWRFVRRPPASAPLTDLVAERITRLPPAAAELLAAVAVGESLEASFVATLASADTLAALERSGWILVDDTPARVRLAHPAYAGAIRESLGGARTVAVNRALADAADAADDLRCPQVDPVQRAVWRLDGGGPADAGLLLRAARAAYFARNDHLASRLADAAVGAGGGADALVVRGQALIELGDHAGVEALLGDVALAGLADRERIAVARCRSFALFWGLEREVEALDVLREAESQLDDPHHGEELRGEQALLHLLCGRVAISVEMAEPILGGQNPRAGVTAAVPAEVAMALTGRAEKALTVVDDALAQHAALGPQEALPQPGMHLVGRALALVELARLEEASALCEQGHHAALERPSAAGQAWFALLAGHATLLQGRVLSAGRWFAEAAGLFADTGELGPRRWALGGCVLTASLSGDPAAGDDALALLDAPAPRSAILFAPEVERARSWHLAARGQGPDARRNLTEAVMLAFANGTPALALAAVFDLARLGAPLEAAQLLPAAPSGLDALAARRAQHVCAMAAGDGPALEAVAVAWARCGAALFAAEAAAAASMAWRRAGDRRRAAATANRAAELAARCEGAATPGLRASGNVAVLTRREREVAELAARGLSARAVADRLAISPRTVENHLQRSYVKLHVSTRQELAGALGIEPEHR